MLIAHYILWSVLLVAFVQDALIASMLTISLPYVILLIVRDLKVRGHRRLRVARSDKNQDQKRRDFAPALFAVFAINIAGFGVTQIVSGPLPLYLIVLLVAFAGTARTSRELLKDSEDKIGLVRRLSRAAEAALMYSLVDASRILFNNHLGRQFLGMFRTRKGVDCSSVATVLFLCHSYIGDAILQTPSIELLRRKFPRARITVLTNRTTDQVLVYNPHISETICSLPPAGESLSLNALIRLLKVRFRNFDLCVLDAEGSQTAGKLLARLAGPRYLIGDATAMPEYNHLLDEAVPTCASLHRVEQSLAVIENSSLGAQAPSRIDVALTPILTSTAGELTIARKFWLEHGLDGAEVVVGLVVGSTGGLATAKRWPLEQFVRLVDALRARKKGIKILAFQGPAEGDLNYQLLSDRGSIIVKEKPLLVTAGIISRCSVLVGNDSGLGHVAASLATPTITIFGPTDAKLIKPYSGNAQVLRTTNCPPCFGGRFLERCGGKRDCIVGVTVDQVCDAVMSASAISRTSEPMALGAAAAES